jgi:hypothetical protein
VGTAAPTTPIIDWVRIDAWRAYASATREGCEVVVRICARASALPIDIRTPLKMKVATAVDFLPRT